jgi:glycosyltransferase involved in cell wall biosynthesis
MKKIALICNSTNPDLFKYFISKGKIKDLDVVNNIHFYTNSQKVSEVDFPCKISSFSKKSSGDKFLIFDFFWAFVLWVQFLLFGIRVVVFDSAHISNIPISILCKLSKIRIVLTVHDWNPHEGENHRKVVLYNWFFREILADEFIVFSSVDYLKKRVHKLTLSGFDPNFLTKNDPDSFLFFGRIEPYKGLGNLVAIAKVAKDLKISAKFVIAGKGNDPNLTELSKLDNIEIINRYILDSEIEYLFSKARACIVPYDSATQSGVVICSYSYNTPIIAFDVGNLSEYIQDGKTGFLVKHKDFNQFVQCLSIKDSDIEKMSNNIKVEFLEKYSVEAMQKQYVDLFRSL